MKNGSMFGQLRKYKEESFGKEHPYFYLYTPDGKTMKYQVFAVSIVEDTAESYNKFYSDDEDFLKYIEHEQLPGGWESQWSLLWESVMGDE